MYEFKVENDRNEVLNLTTSKKFDVLEVDGLYPPSATMTTTAYANIDGSIVNSAKILTRAITLTIRIRPRVDENRNLLYNYLTPRCQCKFYVKTDLNNVYINAFVETMEITMFSQTTIATIGLICADPFFYDVNPIVRTFRTNGIMFEHPFSIDDDGRELSTEVDGERTTTIEVNEDTGYYLTICNISDSNTIGHPKIINLTTGESIKFSRVIGTNENLEISTYTGKKTAIYFNRITQSTVQNALQYFTDDSGPLFILKKGKNELKFEADRAENAVLELRTANKYLGV